MGEDLTLGHEPDQAGLHGETGVDEVDVTDVIARDQDRSVRGHVFGTLDMQSLPEYP
jgi:hypothetical protein